MKRISTLGLGLLMAAVLAACGGGGSDSSTASAGSTGSTGSSGSGSSSGSSGGATAFPFTRYDVYALYGTGLNTGTNTVASVSATQGTLSTGSVSFRGAQGGGGTTVTLGTGSVSLTSAVVATADLSWLAPGADGQLVQQCSVVRQDVSGASVGGYAKSMMVMVAGTATALGQVSGIPTGTRLYAAEDCQFTGGTPTGDIAKVTAQANDSAVVNADGSVTVSPIGAASFTVSAADVGAALAAGGTGLDVVGDVVVPSAAGKANGSYAMHAYSLPRTGATPRYVVVIQATPTGGNVATGSKGSVSMLVSA
ncbi:hypothetical protein [Roseateles saccharophilus]|uniref:Lipoprotein n=1 Tax=Roseateles saccharophilus TaxID=304 RepID=A0A4R3UJH8_ROSSA|nr:hypothetical protein [Roseateles saccharophilus]MDG0834807.1 hypothetical protein [Roseateles saccharophilus]TCU88929.1 hypothetical protein EV671_103711 [Roseateles saccharophilus]